MALSKFVDVCSNVEMAFMIYHYLKDDKTW